MQNSVENNLDRQRRERSVLRAKRRQERVSAKPINHHEEDAAFTQGAHPGDLRSESLRMENMQREHIVRVLTLAECHIAGSGGVAEISGMEPGTLRERMKKLGIRRQPAG